MTNLPLTSAARNFMLSTSASAAEADTKKLGVKGKQYSRNNGVNPRRWIFSKIRLNRAFFCALLCSEAPNSRRRVKNKSVEPHTVPAKLRIQPAQNPYVYTLNATIAVNGKNGKKDSRAAPRNP